MTLPSELVQAIADMSALPADELAALRNGFWDVAADERQSAHNRRFANLVRTVIDRMPDAPAIETLELFDAALNAARGS